MVAGDFNDISCSSEIMSHTHDSSASQRRKFSNNINKCNLVDMGSSGPKYTWSNGRQGIANVQKRLDRALCNEDWRQLFPEGTTLILPRTYSDHSHLLIYALGYIPNGANRPFRFEAAWLMDPSFEDRSKELGLALISLITYRIFQKQLQFGIKMFSEIFLEGKDGLGPVLKAFRNHKALNFPTIYFYLKKILSLSSNKFLPKKKWFGFKNSEVNGLLKGRTIPDISTSLPLFVEGNPK